MTFLQSKLEMLSVRSSETFEEVDETFDETVLSLLFKSDNMDLIFGIRSTGSANQTVNKSGKIGRRSVLRS